MRYLHILTFNELLKSLFASVGVWKNDSY